MRLRKDDFDAEEAVFGWLIGKQGPAGDRGFIELEGMHTTIALDGSLQVPVAEIARSKDLVGAAAHRGQGHGINATVHGALGAENGCLRVRIGSRKEFHQIRRAIAVGIGAVLILGGAGGGFAFYKSGQEQARVTALKNAEIAEQKAQLDRLAAKIPLN